MKRRGILGLACALLVCAGCVRDPSVVASNCEDPDGCVTPAALTIDAVDILLVLDNSGSIAEEAKRLQAELPRLLEALTAGEDGDTSFPPAKSVHVAVTTTDMGIDEPNVPGCSDGLGQDGLFVRPGQVGLTCEVSYPGYLSYDGEPAPVSTVSSVGCLPLVLPEATQAGPLGLGCGYEQPLEAALKSLWPKDRESVAFNSGSGHGLDANAGFLRENSLLVVIVVTDEDDCSADDLSAFDASEIPVNLRCSESEEKLYRVDRYIAGLKVLRPNNPNVIFGLIAGVPTAWVSDAKRIEYDLTDDEDARRYYDGILSDGDMQEVVENSTPEFAQTANLRPSCTTEMNALPPFTTARPPRRLIEVAKAFGTQSVVGSICSADYGATTGRLIRAIGERLGSTEPD